jgi:hypothetical protein
MMRLECKKLPVSLIDFKNFDEVLETISKLYDNTEYSIKFICDFYDLAYIDFNKVKDKQQELMFSNELLSLWLYKDKVIQVSHKKNKEPFEIIVTTKAHYQEICYREIEIENEKKLIDEPKDEFVVIDSPEEPKE